MPGVQILRERIAEKMESLYGARYHPDSEITITSGGTQAIYTAITAVVRPGDEVIVIEPAYDCYVPAIELAGGLPVYVQLELPSGKVDWEQVRKAIRPRTRMIIVNTPHNPTGSCFDASDLETLKQLTDGTEILILVTRSMNTSCSTAVFIRVLPDIRNWPTVRWWSSPLGRPIMLPAGRWAIAWRLPIS